MIKTALLISVFVVVTFGLLAWVYFMNKANKIKKQYMDSNVTETYGNAFENKNKGYINGELKKTFKNPLDDKVLLFLVDTLFRNKYSKSSLVGFKDSYVQESIIELANQEIVLEKNSEIQIMNFSNYTDSDVKKFHKNMKDKSMIFIVNCDKKNKDVIQLIQFLDENKYKYDFENIGNGVIIIGK